MRDYDRKFYIHISFSIFPLMRITLYALDVHDFESPEAGEQTVAVNVRALIGVDLAALKIERRFNRNRDD